MFNSGECSTWNTCPKFLLTMSLTWGAVDPVSAVATGVSAVTNFLNNRQQSKEAEKNRQFQREMQSATMSFNSRENRLNREAQSITEQAKQMKESGINPAAASQQLHSGGSAIGSSSAASGAMPNTKPILGATDLAAVENLRADTKLKDAEAEKTKTETDWIGAINENTIALSQSEILLNQEQASRLATLTPEEKSKINKEIQQIDKNMELIDQKIQETLSQINLNDASAEHSRADLKRIDAEVKKLHAQAASAYSQAALNSALTDSQKLDLKRAFETYNDIIEQTKAFTKSAQGNANSDFYKGLYANDTWFYNVETQKLNWQIMDWQERQEHSKADLLSKDVQFYEVDKAFSYLNQFTGAIGNCTRGYSDVKNANTNRMNAHTKQREVEVKSYYDFMRYYGHHWSR